ncbi:MAG TPA: retropepsin-like aspartic protease [Syntrophobacteria bacterium]|nr:retropepsin-like aspartic protease [Syntrophobacteria bacterium]
MEGTLRGPTGKEQPARFLVDSGATHSFSPKPLWQEIELRSKRKMTFSLADGTILERQVSECYLMLAHGEAHTSVIWGEEGDEALLGIVTLEILGLALKPFTPTLQPMRMMLA